MHIPKRNLLTLLVGVGLFVSPALCPAAALPSPGPDPASAAAVVSAPAKSTATTRSIRVHGGYRYHLPMESVPVASPMYSTDRTVWAYGVDGATVNIHDKSLLVDRIVATTTTDQAGNFDVTFQFDNALGDPDLHAEIVSANDRIRIERQGLHTTWETNSMDYNDFTGTDLDVGVFHDWGRDDADMFFHDLTVFTRMWRWLATRGYDCPYAIVIANEAVVDMDIKYNAVPGIGVFEMDSMTFYEPTKFGPAYMHHWARYFSRLADSLQYCNPGGYGDVPGIGCSIGEWCTENDNVAWIDGLGLWAGRSMTAEWPSLYNTRSVEVYDFENLHTCEDTRSLSDAPGLTPGFVAAMLTDIADSNQDIHAQFADAPGSPVLAEDVLSVGTNPILLCASLDEPTTPQGFLQAFGSRYASWAPDLWRTARNSGFETDTQPPQPVISLSSSHANTGDSADATVDFEWTEPADDASGVAGYAVTMSTSGPETPPAVATLGRVQSWTTAPLAPGSYWFNIRPVDAAGRWCPNTLSYGPVTIRAAVASNLAFKPLAGWHAPLVPTSSFSNPSPESCPAPTDLYGDDAGTNANCSLENTGDVAIEGGFSTTFRIDGVPAWSWGYGLTLDGHASATGNNLGAFTVPGGRHTLTAELDAGGGVPETCETDNVMGGQWVWRPTSELPSTGARITHAAPPSPTAGWDALPDSVTRWPNCDGYRVDNYHYYTQIQVFKVAPARRNDDMDLHLHDMSASPTSGFAESVAASTRGPGCLDMVFVNNQVHSFGGRFDLGVTNANGASGDYTLSIGSFDDYIMAGASTTGALNATVTSAAVLCWEQNSPTDRYTARLVTTPTDVPVNMAFVDFSSGLGSLGNALAVVRTVDGVAQFEHVNGNGPQFVVVYRDPREGSTPVNWTLTFVPSPPDVTPTAPAGWHSPLVPRATADATGTSVPAPTSPLPGGTGVMYWNMAYLNASAIDAGSFYATISIDGTQRSQDFQGWLQAQDVALKNNLMYSTIAGGRHTAALRLDDTNALHELNRANNAHGEQWVWSPLVMADGAFTMRSAVPDPFGGFQNFTASEPFYPNCDGLRMRADISLSQYEALAVLSSATYDVDLRLHAMATTAKDGFTTPLAASQWGVGKIDFVIANAAVNNGRDYDVGVTTDEGGHETYYSAEAVHALRVPPSPSGSSGSWPFPVNHLMDLREFYLTPGLWDFKLTNGTGSIDWGISLYPNNVEHLGKSDVIPGAIAYSAGPGQPETFSTTITTTGWYCLAVWKSTGSDLMKEGRYGLRVTQRWASDVPGDQPPAPVRTALTGIHPNPFNPQATVSFALATAGHARLAVYDLHGTRVRTLVDGDVALGLHDVTWDGRDDRGQGVASGVYFARLEAGDVVEMKKMVLMK